MIVGGAVGGVALLAVFALLIFCCRKWRRGRRVPVPARVQEEVREDPVGYHPGLNQSNTRMMDM